MSNHPLGLPRPECPIEGRSFPEWAARYTTVMVEYYREVHGESPTLAQLDAYLKLQFDYQRHREETP